jgi:cellulose synthase/poly-beta-1,6-N-acetylglucosamine synthase-like glycosyltransferase
MEQPYTVKKRQLALILPAHNEEVVISSTIQSAIAAGMEARDIFVVSDGSKDRTIQIGVELLPWYNTFAQDQGGKAMAISNGIKHFNIVERYEWLHIADADGTFSRTYFDELKSHLSRDFVAATGHVQSLGGNWISQYRTYEYTLGLEVMRRIQAFLGTIPVIPGATCVFRTDIIDKLDFTLHSLTEDMDLTLQIHRQKLGKIAYIPSAKAFTQDPKNFSDYFTQIMRWYRGAWQVMGRHKLGRRLHKIDAYMAWMIIEEVVMLLEITLLPLLSIYYNTYGFISMMFLMDLVVFLGVAIWSAGLNKRQEVISAFPLFYILRFVNLFAFFRAWFEIVVQHKFSSEKPGWSTAGRRYRIATEAVRIN